MSDEKFSQLSLRLPAALVERIDAAAKIETERTGYNINRTEFCRAALAKACTEVETQQAKGGQP